MRIHAVQCNWCEHLWSDSLQDDQAYVRCPKCEQYVFCGQGLDPMSREVKIKPIEDINIVEFTLYKDTTYSALMFDVWPTYFIVDTGQGKVGLTLDGKNRVDIL